MLCYNYDVSDDTSAINRLHSLRSSLVLRRLDYGNATLYGIPGLLVQRLQS